jgi:branched-chain amino acid aminotransferase
MKVCLNGKLVRSDLAKVSVFDHGFLYGDGVYETLRTYGGKVWQLREHLVRLRSSARALKIEVPWSDEQVSNWLNALLKANGFVESRIRISVTRGVNGFDFTASKEPTLVIVASKLVPEPVEVYTKGVSLISLPWQRFLPNVKTSNVLPMILAQPLLKKKKAYEGIFLDQKKNVLEGTMTNVTAVFGNTLIAPKDGVLAGETQKTVLQIAKKNGLSIKRGKLSLKKLLQADEVFLTSTVREIMPVRMVDGKKIWGSCPGTTTKFLMGALKEFTEA